MTDARTSGQVVSPGAATDRGSDERQLTFLFTDIVSSTRFWDLVPIQMDRALARHDKVLAAAVAARNGQLVKHTGDGMMAVFDRPIDALLAGVEAQAALGSIAWDDDAVIEARMGLHCGSAIKRDGDYFGTCPNRCARIMGLANGGQILLSEEVARAVAPDLTSHGIELRELGEHTLRGLSRAERIHQATAPGLRFDFPPLAGTLSLAPLPRPGAPLVGRDREIEALRATLDEADLVTLLGPGGVGKTRLAAHVAGLEQAERGRAVAYIELAPAYSSVVARTIASGVGVSRGGDEQPLDALVRALQGFDVLLVLDNAEHVIPAVSEVVERLRSECPGATVLVTSQAPLGRPGERVVTVEPLDTRPGGAATQLFTERALEVDPTFDPSAHQPAIAAICATLDGLPLAVELAAARVRTMDPEQILERLDRRLGFLRLPPGHPRAERGDTLGAAIGWSYELLDEPEQRVLDRLGVFRGPFTLASAEAVAGFDPIDVWDVADLLDRLVRRSLVIVQGRGPFRRFRLLESIAAFAVERLVAGEGDGTTRARHAAHYLSGLADLDEGDDAAVDALDLDSGNLRAAVAWSATEDSPGTARLLLSKYRAMCALGWQDDAHAWFRIVAAHQPFDSAADQALLLQRIGQLSMATGYDLEHGRAMLEAALTVAGQAGDESRAVAARLQLATLLSLYPASLDLDAATEHLAALETALASGQDPWVEARVHNCAALVHLYRRESAEGVARARRAQEAAAPAGLRVLVSRGKCLEGANLAYSGAIDDGLALMEEAWLDAVELGDGSIASSTAWMRGYASILLADPRDALHWFGRELESGRADKAPAIRRSLRANLGTALVLLGHLEQAAEIAQDFLAINGTLLEPLLTFVHGGFDEAERTTTKLLEHLAHVGDRNEYAAVAYWTGRFHNVTGRDALAKAHLDEALEIALRPPACPYYEVPLRAELALLGDATQLPELAALAAAHPIRGLEARVHLAEAVAGPADQAEDRFAGALAVADAYGLVMDRVEILIRRGNHRWRHGDRAGSDADRASVRNLLEPLGIVRPWQFAMEVEQ